MRGYSSGEMVGEEIQEAFDLVILIGSEVWLNAVGDFQSESL
jgi:hypothetical protein